MLLLSLAQLQLKPATVHPVIMVELVLISTWKPLCVHAEMDFLAKHVTSVSENISF